MLSHIKEIIVVACLGLISASIQADESYRLLFLDKDEELKLALSAGPEHIRNDATVYTFGKSGYELAQKGSNGFICLVNRDGSQNGDLTLRPTCWDDEGSKSIVPVMLRVGELLTQGKSSDEIKTEIERGYAELRFRAPTMTGIAYMLVGDVQFDAAKGKISKTVFPAHYMIYAPSVTNEALGITEDAQNSQFMLPFGYDGYSGGANTAYIIVMAMKK